MGNLDKQYEHTLCLHKCPLHATCVRFREKPLMDAWYFGKQYYNNTEKTCYFYAESQNNNSQEPDTSGEGDKQLHQE